MQQNNETLNKDITTFNDVLDYLKYRVSEEDLGLIISDFERRYETV